MAKNSCQKVPKCDFQTQLSNSISNVKNHPNLSKKKISLRNINLGALFLSLLIFCSIKIERLLFLKFLKNLAFFDSYFWPFEKSEEKISHFCNQCNHNFNLKCFYQIPLTWWKTYSTVYAVFKIPLQKRVQKRCISTNACPLYFNRALDPDSQHTLASSLNLWKYSKKIP